MSKHIFTMQDDEAFDIAMNDALSSTDDTVLWALRHAIFEGYMLRTWEEAHPEGDVAAYMTDRSIALAWRDEYYQRVMS